MSQARIFLYGGGGFADYRDIGRLDNFSLLSCGSDIPRVCFVPTASGDSGEEIAKFYSVFNHRSCRPSHLGLFRPTTFDTADLILNQDLVYIGGGSSINLDAIMSAHDLSALLGEALTSGVSIIGVSAGANVLCRAAITYSRGFAEAFRPRHPFCDFSICVHASDGAPGIHPYRHAVATGDIPNGYEIPDGACLVCDLEGNVIGAVSELREARVRRTDCVDGGTVVSKDIPTRYLE